MKSILLSIKPEWVAKILNGEKTIEVRKKFPKDYVGWVYIYCSKNGNKETDRELLLNRYGFCKNDRPYGKVVARFWCDKTIEYINGLNWKNIQYDTASYDDYKSILEPSCLTDEELYNYCKYYFFAIHISKLEIFDKPRDIDEFWNLKDDRANFTFTQLTKAPQNYCYVEGE